MNKLVKLTGQYHLCNSATINDINDKKKIIQISSIVYGAFRGFKP